MYRIYCIASRGHTVVPLVKLINIAAVKLKVTENKLNNKYKESHISLN